MEVSVLSVIPFVLLLLSIAIVPFVNRGMWEKNYPYFSIMFSIVIVIYYISINKSDKLLYTAEQYIEFISLLTSLFIISGGILIEIKGLSTPARNVLLLAIGAVLSNVIGTTGASMLLIRPYIKTNNSRISPFHIVFFIFIVSNIGGMLTPIGDPPLFLGYLNGIPFFWIGEKVFFKWLFAMILLLITFYFLDFRNFKKQPEELIKKEKESHEVLSVSGWYNIVLMVIVIGSVFITRPLFVREIIMLLSAIISYKITGKEIHAGNSFNFHPIKEVAVLFMGIFITLAPVVELLQRHSKDIGITSPTNYYWLTGILSALLDSAPAYMAFLSAAMGYYGLNTGSINDVSVFISAHENIIISISISAVFFGAATYIGNAPNFMVKSIADNMGIKTPHFFEYIIKYSVPILLPLFVIIWLLIIL